MNVSLLVPTKSTFGENVWPRSRPGSQRKGDNFLRVAHSVNGGRIDPVNAKLECAMNRGYRCFIILLAPTKFPAGAADGPGAEADGRDRQVRVTEPLRFHFNPFKFRFHVPAPRTRAI